MREDANGPHIGRSGHSMFGAAGRLWPTEVLAPAPVQARVRTLAVSQNVRS